MATSAKNLMYTDYEQVLYNKGYVISFQHLPSSKIVSFKGRITAFEDKYSSDWNTTHVYGRSDPIETFQGTRRTISLGWDIVAASIDEAKDNLSKVALLVSMLYPSYDDSASTSGASTISSAPVLRLSFANLIHNTGPSGQNIKTKSAEEIVTEGTKNVTSVSTVNGLVGRVDGFSHVPDIDVGFFDPEAAVLYPKVIRISCNFTVYHTHKLGWTRGGNPREGFNKFPYGSTLVDQPDNPQTSDDKEKRLEQQKSQEEKILNSQAAGSALADVFKKIF